MTLDAELEQWQPAGHAVRIEYSRAVMDQLRMQATEGFNRIAHGGVEVGGVLFGHHEEGTVTILAHREVSCEYAFGPSYTLSSQDRLALEELLSAPATEDQELSSMQAVGWYHSHTRSDIGLSERDLELYDEYFPEPWQVALVLRPHRFDPVRAGFFFREADGSVNRDATLQEFLIAPAARKPVSRPPVEEAPEPPPPPAAAPPLEIVCEAPQLPSQPPTVTVAASARRTVPWSWIAAGSVALLAAGLFGIAKSGPAGVSLHAKDIGSDQVRIDWDHNARAIQGSAGGELEIQDGASKVRADLSRELLLTGHITYLRTSGQVTVRLILRNPDGRAVTHVTSFAGSPVVVAAAPPPSTTPAPPPIAVLEKAPEITAAPSPPREQEADRARELPVRESPRTERVAPPVEVASQTPAPATARLRLWVPPSRRAVSVPAELPSPPAITASAPAPIPNAAAPIAAIAPAPAFHLPATLPDQGPAAGNLIWTGNLPRGGTISIQGNHASIGHLTGSLPSVPMRIRVFSTELTQSGLKVFTSDAASVGVPEAAGAQNGWMQTTWLLNPKKAGELRIVEAPAKENGWNRVSVKAERGDHSVIVLHWERVTVGL